MVLLERAFKRRLEESGLVTLFAFGFSVVRTQWSFGTIFPMALANFLIAVRVQWIVNLIVGAFMFAHDQKTYILVRIVQHRMRNARSRLEADCIAWFQPHQVSVQPNIRRSFDHVYELFFRSLRMWPARSPSRRKHFVMYTESLKTKGSSKRTTNR